MEQTVKPIYSFVATLAENNGRCTKIAHAICLSIPICVCVSEWRGSASSWCWVMYHMVPDWIIKYTYGRFGFAKNGRYIKIEQRERKNRLDTKNLILIFLFCNKKKSHFCTRHDVVKHKQSPELSTCATFSICFFCRRCLCSICQLVSFQRVRSRIIPDLKLTSCALVQYMRLHRKKKANERRGAGKKCEQISHRDWPRSVIHENRKKKWLFPLNIIYFKRNIKQLPWW